MSASLAACELRGRAMSERALAVGVGVPFDVEFSAPDAGHEWRLVEPPPGIELLSRIFRRTSEDATGDAFRQLFHLRATAAGRYELAFRLGRRSEGTPVQAEVVVIEATLPAA